MDGYVCRLIKCDYTPEKAQETIMDILRNFSVAELDIYVRYVEDTHDVDKI